MGNVIIVAVLALILFAAIRSSVKHVKGEGGCCGGGSSGFDEPDKKLSGTIIKTKVFAIEGMHCENCTNSVKRAINRIDGVSAKLSLKKKQALVEYEKEVSDDVLVMAIENLGYKVVSVE